MAHLTSKGGYRDLVGRLNRMPNGAPESKHLYDILSILMDKNEAALLAKIPVRPFTADAAAKRWKMPVAEAKHVLDRLASRAILVDIEADEKHGGQTRYVLPPPMAGFFEFSIMRTRGDIDQKALSELFHQYLTVEGDFMEALFKNGPTQQGRAFIDEGALELSGHFVPDSLEVLDYEKASHVIESASDVAVGMCYCRHKMQHADKACDAPMDICMTFNTPAASLIRHGYARKVEAAEALDLLQRAREEKLVQFGENVRNEVSFMCHCCGCCCEALTAARRFGHLDPIHTTNFVPDINDESCTGCGLCVGACPMQAMKIVSKNDPEKRFKRVARLDEDACLGCGVCIRACPRSGDALGMAPRESRVLTPVNSIHRHLVMALERGTLQDMIFDNDALLHHRMMAGLLGAILKLPPVKRTLAAKALNSRYIEKLVENS